MNIEARGSNFVDNLGRKLMLRGINLSGSSKIPFKPDGEGSLRENFFEHRNVSFIGRPFPLNQAEEHLARLREWGFNFLRLLITWEAIEHTGPGIYDEAYLDYLVEIVKKAGEFGFNLFIDPHQDVWSRFSGGDGAPSWTLEAVGLDMTKFVETGAAIVNVPQSEGNSNVLWSTNAHKLAAATMFTLFFGGNDFAPRLKVDGIPVQEYLQAHYIAAIRQVALRLQDLPDVLGYDVMNEPYSGYIGTKDLSVLAGIDNIGLSPTPYQGMLLGAAFPQEVAFWEIGRASLKQTGTRRINESRQKVWLNGRDCLWREHGVWDLDASGEPHLLKPDYFSVHAGQPVNFARDYYRPFVNRFAAAIHSVNPAALIFIESQPDTPPPDWGKDDAANIVFAQHWYDAYVLAKRDYSSFLAVNTLTRRVIITAPFIKRSFAAQLDWHKQRARHELGGVPCVLGEFGIPFDLQGKKAYRTGDFRLQIKALQRTYQAVEANLLDSTLWNYTPDNSNSHGDQWNGEDFSIYSADQRTDPRDINSGGRALSAVVRPYPLATSGELLEASFNPSKRRFIMKFRDDPAISAPTEIFVPNYQYPHGYVIQVSDGRYEIKRSQQMLLYWPSLSKRVHRITIKP